jgi:hypothetical protein
MRLKISLAVVLMLGTLSGCGTSSPAPAATARTASSADARFLTWITPRVGRSYAKDALVLEAKAPWFHGFKSSSFTIQAPAPESMRDTTGQPDDKKVIEMVTTAFLGKDGGVYFQPFTMQTVGNETRMVYEGQFYHLATYQTKNGAAPGVDGELKLNWLPGVKLELNGMPFRHKSYMLKVDKAPVARVGEPDLWAAPASEPAKVLPAID